MSFVSVFKAIKYKIATLDEELKMHYLKQIQSLIL